ncbi:contact-dependent growth inhibition system immunity protein [Rubinisphaera margarita]|uniref:contact-dependent growth inhibition system immunity protein n=1 Tax=Rubinisphaera margarita TaxID=2909586 RepID=UPI001EE954E8|nr:contact-dependent growth inhibition system immunity protein [Rubinisphaera margarita]MCG6155943.1 hypothetical protein [Rubinisphaera margarita]
MKITFDRRKSLEELERFDWDKPDSPTQLVQTCHRLRGVPLAEFTAGDLRIMIGQKISLQILIPLALEKLLDDPLVDSNYYPGDLLKAVLDVPESFWSVHADMRDVLLQVVTTTKQLIVSLEESDARPIQEILAKVPASI